MDEEEMDEEKKKQINDAITVIRNLCITRKYCSGCPFSHNCGMAEHNCAFPYHWQNIE